VALVHPVTGLFAGVGRMRPLPFLFFNLLGSAAYALLYASLGYFFGESWDLIKEWMGRAGVLSLAGLLILAGLAYLIRRRFPSLLSLFSKVK
jgi:membrane protein DedA with SNARE-associated domain